MTRLTSRCWSLAAASAGGILLTSASAIAQTRPMKIEPVALDNPYVTVSRNNAPCAKAEAGRCEDRVVLAMGDLEMSMGGQKRAMKRGNFAVVKAGETYEIAAGARFYEIAIKPGHPPVRSPPEVIPPPRNLIVHQGQKFFIYEEILPVGETRPRHTHFPRVEVRLNTGPVLHQWVWKDGVVTETEPNMVNWREPNVHEVHNIGDAPLRNFIVEFLPKQ